MTCQNYNIFHHFRTVANFPSHFNYIHISSLDVKLQAKSMKPSPKIKTINPDVKVDLANLLGKCILL